MTTTPDLASDTDEVTSKALASAFEHAPEALLVLDLDGRQRYANRRWRALAEAGRKPAARGEWTDPIFVGERARVTAACARAAANGEEATVEFRVNADNGEMTWMLARVTRFDDIPGEPPGVIVAATDVGAIREREERLARLADQDEVTGLFRRRRFEIELHRQVEGARRYGWRGSLALLDVDGLKRVNDRDGHAAGDRLLQEVGAALRRRLRGTDVAARIGGDEFALLLPGTDVDGAEALADDLRRGLRQVTVADEPITVSCGITSLGGEASDKEIWAEADRALYTAKFRGPGSIQRAPLDPGP